MHWQTQVLGAMWLVLGLIFLRRAYVGQKPQFLVTLRPAQDPAMRPRDRWMALLLGAAGLFHGTFDLFFSRR